MKNDTATQHTRQLTICNKHFPRKKSRDLIAPVITFSGKWLQQQGFRAGHVIDTACSQGQLVITIAKEQRFKNI